MKEQFIEHRFQKDSLVIIDKANEILAEYKKQNLVLTLRQLYYQFVARGLIANNIKSYTKIGNIISDARLAGLVDWAMMEDRTRYVRSTSAWTSPEAILDAVADQYKENLWADQPFVPEVWIEKDALVGVIEPACQDLRVSYFACRGYASQSIQYEAGLRYRKLLKAGREPVILHLGDHDPSGIDMTRDNQERIAMFAREKIEVRRLALNIDQVRKYTPPPNPAKETDSRSADYKVKFGDESWELDALNPTVIDKLIRDAVMELRNEERWKKALEKENKNKALLKRASDDWEEVKKFLGEDEEESEDEDEDSDHV